MFASTRKRARIASWSYIGATMNDIVVARKSNRIHEAVTRFDIVVHWHCYASLQMFACSPCVCSERASACAHDESHCHFLFCSLHAICVFFSVSLQWQRKRIFPLKKIHMKEEKKKWSHRICGFSFCFCYCCSVCRRCEYANEMSVNSIKSTFESSIRIVKQWDKMPSTLIIRIIIIICTLSLLVCMLACGWHTGLSCRRWQWINMTYFSTKHGPERMNLNCWICIRKTETRAKWSTNWWSR